MGLYNEFIHFVGKSVQIAINLILKNQHQNEMYMDTHTYLTYTHLIQSK